MKQAVHGMDSFCTRAQSTRGTLEGVVTIVTCDNEGSYIFPLGPSEVSNIMQCVSIHIQKYN